MKKTYNCPATEVIAVNATYSICAVSENAPLINGGGTETIDPGQGI